MTHKIVSGVDVDAPVAAVYNQWTQFEEFPRFMKHVKTVHQIDDEHLHWKVQVGGAEREFETKIVEQIPDKRIAWRSTTGMQHSGVVTFHRLNDSKCHVAIQLEYEPRGLAENVAQFVGLPRWDLNEDLAHFVAFIERRKMETGAWRGRILNKDEQRGARAWQEDA